jgi:hypothetical protein
VFFLTGVNEKWRSARKTFCIVPRQTQRGVKTEPNIFEISRYKGRIDRNVPRAKDAKDLARHSRNQKRKGNISRKARKDRQV